MQVRSMITGTVIEICVQAGSAIRCGDELMVIQSMKMDIPVKSPGDGVIQLLAVSPGGVVNEGDLLAEIA